jgi:outer membrane protein OmpA-like peptidoglycan-associated protein
MKNMKNYLPEKFTLEMDLWLTKVPKSDDQEVIDKNSYSYSLYFYDENGDDFIARFYIVNWDVAAWGNYDLVNMRWDYRSTSGTMIDGSATTVVTTSGWHHLSISFNQRAFKLYINGTRYVNIPNMAQPANFRFNDENMMGKMLAGAVTNVRFAKGAVPLYDRMMSDGKFITYGITFDVGKSTIKPESMGEINRIVTLMNENPSLKFSVEGHTDSTGGAAANQTLSEARSQSVVDKLVENGIAKDRFKAAGKGQNSPIADNSTDEGRAKNRRVEFVKF